MYLDRDELRPCRACGAPCDGDVCDAFCADVLAREVEDESDDDAEDEA